MSSLISAELAATCSALGYFDQKTNKYYADGNTLETTKDLIRYLRRDDDSFDIRRQLGETKVLQTDLLPLIKFHAEEIELFDVILRLLVNLTTPALMLWQEEVPIELTQRNHYLQIEDHLHNYKQSFADIEVWAVLSKRMSKILEVDFSERGDENSLIIERILILVRNVLYVPSNPDAERRPDNDASIHDQVLWALHQSAMLDIILYISSSITEQAYYMHILEILSFMLREQSASELASAALQRSQTEKLRDQAELVAIRQRENVQKQQKSRVLTGTRHSRFGGTYVVESMKSISDNSLIYHKPLSRLDDLNFDADKQKAKTPRNRVPLQSVSTERRSAFSIRLFLKEFCVEFLNASYNTLMHEAKRALLRQKAQKHDESFYLWAMRFFMEFNRHYKKFQMKLVSETMSVQSFHFVQQQSETYFDMIQTDKKKIKLWSRRLHLSLLAYRELLMTLCFMDKSEDEGVRRSSQVIKSNIFYVLEYRELILTLLLTYDELKMSDAYLNDLMETQHVFFKMLQNYCTSGDLVVQTKGKNKRKGNKKSKSKSAMSEGNLPVKPDLNALWDEASPQLSVVLEGGLGIPKDIVPFDAASDAPIDEQKSETIKNIQRKLKDGEFEEAVGLLRAAREVWPENDSFGSNNMAPEEEFLALKDVFFADLGVAETEQTETTAHPEDDENDEDDEEEEVERSMQISEGDFKFEDFAKRLAHPKILRACGLALKKFEKNSTLTNHCVIKLMHRIAWDCKMPGMVFQASIFRTFQKIYNLKDVKAYKELAKFADYIIREFIKVAKINSKVYIEALFWKNSKDAYDIENGYGATKEHSQASAKAWSELEEEELRRLFIEHREKEIDEDPVDWIVGNLIDNTRTRRGVLKKLKEMYLLTDYKGPRKSGISAGKARIPKQWSEEEEIQLRELFQEFKDTNDPVDSIVEGLDVKRSKPKVIEKILELGLVQDRKELRKKRKGKKSGFKSGKGLSETEISDGDEERDVDSDSDRVDAVVKRSVKKPLKTKRRAKTSNQPSAPPVSYNHVLKLVADVESSGMSDAVQWLRESFEDVAEDVEDDNLDDDDIGIPIVPILDCAISAMENLKFLELLKGFGVKEPFDEQEQFWRIPSQLNENIRKFLNNEEINESTNIKNKSNDDDDNEIIVVNKKEDIHEKIRQIFDSDNSDVENNDEINKEITHKRPRIFSSDSDSDIPKKKKTRVLESDEDSE
nr:protein timeless homolog [Onthophagus taurus]